MMKVFLLRNRVKSDLKQHCESIRFIGVTPLCTECGRTTPTLRGAIIYPKTNVVQISLWLSGSLVIRSHHDRGAILWLAC
jgi:hypothetical protein